MPNRLLTRAEVDEEILKPAVEILNRALKKVRAMSPEEREKALAALDRRFGIRFKSEEKP